MGHPMGLPKFTITTDRGRTPRPVRCSHIVSAIGSEAIDFTLRCAAVASLSNGDQDEACPVCDDFHLGHRGTVSRRPHTDRHRLARSPADLC